MIDDRQNLGAVIPILEAGFPAAFRNRRVVALKSANWGDQSVNAGQFAIVILNFSFCNSLFNHL